MFPDPLSAAPPGAALILTLGALRRTDRHDAGYQGAVVFLNGRAGVLEAEYLPEAMGQRGRQ